MVERHSFEELFRVEYPALVRTIAPIVGSTAEAEGVVQDAFTKAFVRWSRIGRYDRPGAWVRRVAVRDAVRVASRARRAAAVVAVSTTPSAEEAADFVDVDLSKALRALPVNQRTAVVLHYLDDQPIATVADALGCKEATVRVHLHRARGALGDALTTKDRP